MNDSSIRALVLEVRRRFPRPLRIVSPEHIDRDILHIHLAFVPNGRLIDLGGGYSPTSAVLAQMGMNVTVVDTFASTKFYEQFSEGELRDVLNSYGVNVVKQDLLDHAPTKFASPNSVDSVVSHETLYYFNPRSLLDSSMTVLKPGGTLAVNVNNAVTLFRRIAVAFGKSNLDSFDSYFFEGVHKRFWTVDDLRLLANYLHLRNPQIFGRNWSAYHSHKYLPRFFLQFLDRAFQCAPGLCNALYLIGKK